MLVMWGRGRRVGGGPDHGWTERGRVTSSAGFGGSGAPREAPQSQGPWRARAAAAGPHRRMAQPQHKAAPSHPAEGAVPEGNEAHGHHGRCQLVAYDLGDSPVRRPERAGGGALVRLSPGQPGLRWNEFNPSRRHVGRWRAWGRHGRGQPLDCMCNLAHTEGAGTGRGRTSRGGRRTRPAPCHRRRGTRRRAAAGAAAEPNGASPGVPQGRGHRSEAPAGHAREHGVVR
jgi:hypothetical protein